MDSGDSGRVSVSQVDAMMPLQTRAEAEAVNTDALRAYVLQIMGDMSMCRIGDCACGLRCPWYLRRLLARHCLGVLNELRDTQEQLTALASASWLAAIQRVSASGGWKMQPVAPHQHEWHRAPEHDRSAFLPAWRCPCGEVYKH